MTKNKGGRPVNPDAYHKGKRLYVRPSTYEIVKQLSDNLGVSKNEVLELAIAQFATANL